MWCSNWQGHTHVMFQQVCGTCLVFDWIYRVHQWKLHCCIVLLTTRNSNSNCDARNGVGWLTEGRHHWLVQLHTARGCQTGDWQISVQEGQRLTWAKTQIATFYRNVTCSWDSFSKTCRVLALVSRWLSCTDICQSPVGQPLAAAPVSDVCPLSITLHHSQLH